MAECMVALLRCQSYASPSDVELYLKNYKSLNYRMTKIDPADVPKDAVITISKKLDKLANQFTDQDKKEFKTNSEYIHLFAWCQHFCKLAETSRIVRELKNKLIADQEKILFLAEYRIRARSCLEDLEMFDTEHLE